MERFDVVVVGARCAGAPLAAMLARRGLRVCLVDRARFPSETLSTHVLQPSGVAALGRLGVLDAVLAAGAVQLTALTMILDDARLEVADLEGSFDMPGLCIRRVALDHLLVEAAAQAGADVRTETAARALIREGGRVTGIETSKGPLLATLVVGADGRTSTVADLAGAAEYDVAPPGRLFTWAYFEGVADREPRLRLGRVGSMAYLASPSDAGLHMVGVCPPLADRHEFLADRDRSFTAGLAGWPELGDLLAGAQRVGPIRVLASWHGYFREGAGPGWALVGDAGHFKDPTPAQGMSDALRQAEHLADAVEAGLGGGGDLDAELLRWWQWRDEDAQEMHWFAADLGAGRSAGPLETQFIRDVAGDRQATQELLRLLDHDVRPSELLTPRRLGGAAWRAARHRPGQIPAMTREAATAVRNISRRRRLTPRRHSISVGPWRATTT